MNLFMGGHMQVKKEELKNDIIKIAENEFFYHGYEAASLRMIAKKANTTLGNLYHYFPSKEAILDAVMEDFPEELDRVIHDHEDYHQEFGVLTYDKIPELETLLREHGVAVFHIDILISRKFVILMQGCDNTKYENVSKEVEQAATEHIAEHCNADGKDKFVSLLMHSMLLTFVDIAKRNLPEEEAIFLLKEYVTTVLLGLMCTLIEK